MAKLIFDGLNHYIRSEEIAAINHMAKYGMKKQLSLFGQSGTGKTEILNHTIEELTKEKRFYNYSVLYFDAFQLECYRYGSIPEKELHSVQV